MIHWSLFVKPFSSLILLFVATSRGSDDGVHKVFIQNQKQLPFLQESEGLPE